MIPSLKPSRFFRLSAFLLAAMAAQAFAAPLTLTEAQLEKKGSAKLDWERDAVRVRFDDAGWDSGVRLLPPDDKRFWDLSQAKLLAVDVENLSKDKQLRATFHITSGSKEDKTYSEVNSGLALNPGEKRTVTLFIPHRSIYKTPSGVRGPKTVDSAKINSIELYMQWPFEGATKGLADFRVSNLRTEGEPDAAAKVADDQFFPFIDVYGQNIHGDWPEKIHSDADLKKARETEDAELARTPRPSEWNRFGGWAKGPQLKATGSFRTEKYQGKWYLVDPEGRLFFSQGLDVLRAHSDATRSTDHEKWFDFKVTDTNLPFNDWNIQKKYGKKNYETDYYATLSKRLEAWGMNTIGNWGKQELMERGDTPYTLQLTDYNSKMPRILGDKIKFYDVFDPDYIDTMKNLVATASERDPLVAKSLKDPMCIGYFIDNELNFGNRGAQILGDMVLQSPPTQAAKKEFIKDLKEKHGSIERLNKAWGSDYASWEAMADRRDVPTSKGYRTDSHAFFDKTVEQYFRLCRDAIKSVAPHRLYLGTRFISTDAVRAPLFKANAKYGDVLSVNVYAHSVANLDAKDFPDMPVIIGEFHFGVQGRGMFSAGLAPTGHTQDERALAYTRFLQGALVHPLIVGTHWFQFRDQPLTGRWDGEGYAIGFVDVADTPYPEMTRASREIGENMYQYRLRGKLNNSMR